MESKNFKIGNNEKIMKSSELECPLNKTEGLDLRTLDTNIIMNKLEENIKLRETPLEKRKIIKT